MNYFSIIIPVFNRPDEVNELLDSLLKTTYTHKFEVVIVEDGSTQTCLPVIEKFIEKLTISYYFKENSGPGDSRNFGMKKAKGDYFIIFDSDCIIPPTYLSEVANELKGNYVDFFGGSDKALKSFSKIQKAINFAMTSFITTGGIRGGSEKITKFQPRSFNMGISKKAFEASKGFGDIHPGEDPDLTIRLWKLGFSSRLFSSAFVYHKRRIDWDKFSLQVNKFGKARPILNYWHKEYAKITYWFPTFFVIAFFASIAILFICFDWAYNDWPLKAVFGYFALIFIISSIQNKNLIIGFYSIIAVWKQFFGYGLGFLKSFFKINILRQKPEKAFPQLFFNNQIANSVQILEEIKPAKVIEKPFINEQKKPNTTTIIAPPSPQIIIDKPIEKQAITAKNIEKNIIKTVEKSIQKTKIIGLTGGIGSGKTTVAYYISSLGIPVYISDIEAKKVMENKQVIAKINTAFDEDITKDGILDRQKLATIVFNNPEKLKILNAIVHPLVKQHFDNWINHYKNEPIVVKEAAILFESGSNKDCNFVISITAPLETRIERVVKRDISSREKVLQRINNQMTEQERNAKSDFVIENINFDQTKKDISKTLNSLLNQ